MATLLDDIGALGMLDETLVILTGEFGRTPKIGGNVGSPFVLARRPRPLDTMLHNALRRLRSAAGRTIGTSDKTASLPVTKAFTPADLGATVYSALGVEPATEIRDLLGRPLRLNAGQPMLPVFSGEDV